MKKLIITAIASVLIGSVANATCVNWGFTSSAYGADYAASADLSGYSAYLILSSDWTGEKADLDKAFQGNVAFTTSMDNGSVRAYGVAGHEYENTNSSLSGDQLFKIVLSDGNKFWASEDVTGTAYTKGSTDPSNKSINLIMTGAASIKAADVKSFSGDVPEPTSGLLIMLGMAGLALRRRRA